MKQWRSRANWSNGMETEDEHDTKEQAEGVCALLEQVNTPLHDSSGWVIKTWVEPIQPNAAGQPPAAQEGTR